jgi:hypothetical protein
MLKKRSFQFMHVFELEQRHQKMLQNGFSFVSRSLAGMPDGLFSNQKSQFG